MQKSLAVFRVQWMWVCGSMSLCDCVCRGAEPKGRWVQSFHRSWKKAVPQLGGAVFMCLYCFLDGSSMNSSYPRWVGPARLLAVPLQSAGRFSPRQVFFVLDCAILDSSFSSPERRSSVTKSDPRWCGVPGMWCCPHTPPSPLGWGEVGACKVLLGLLPSTMTSLVLLVLSTKLFNKHHLDRWLFSPL